MGESTIDLLSRRPVKPFLFRNATPRTHGADIPGRYDHEFSMWVVGEGRDRRPVIAVGHEDILEIETKTKVVQEADDEVGTIFRSGSHSRSDGRAALKPDSSSSRPDAYRPATDRKPHSTAMFDAVTERGTSPSRSMGLLLELETKTEAEMEHDDDSHPVL